jgi:hypothetical protein
MRDEEVTLDYVIDNVVIRGTVNEVVDRILAMHEIDRRFRHLALLRQGLDRRALGRRSMELMAEKVMPAVNAALGRTGSGGVAGAFHCQGFLSSTLFAIVPAVPDARHIIVAHRSGRNGGERRSQRRRHGGEAQGWRAT